MTHHLRGRSDLARPLFEEVLAAPDAHEAGAGILSGAQSYVMRLLPVQGALERSAARANCFCLSSRDWLVKLLRMM